MQGQDDIYDHIIIGAGASGLQVCLALVEHPSTSDDKILILDPDPKIKNDRTYSFWEKGLGQYDSIVKKSWEHAAVINQEGRHHISLAPYTYKTIHAIDFYAYSKEILSSKGNVNWKQEKVEHVIQGGIVEVKTKERSYKSKRVFDSRTDKQAYDQDNKSPKILQHFGGWMIQTQQDSFDDSSVTMMDFRPKDGQSMSFMYVLPFDKKTALVEYTYFNKQLVSRAHYDQAVEKYIKEQLSITSYKVMDKEYGIIPMTTHKFHASNTANYIKIGTGGSWVKSSTGYSFKNAGVKAKLLVSNIAANRPLTAGLYSETYRFWDKIFLDVLAKKNELGEEIFSTLYTRVSAKDLFDFLNEDISTLRMINIFRKMPQLPFVRSLIRQVF